MTALAGILYYPGAHYREPPLRGMLAALAIYGPETSGEWIEGPVALGRRLLPLLPEDRFDTQPLASADNRLRLVADVRLDNRQELAATLGIRPGTLAVMADSALLLAAWERWAERCLEHLVGAFAFALWDRLEHRLFLAVDHSGGRPLYYHHRGGRWFAFASMPKGLHALPELPAELDEDLVAHHLALAPTEQGQLFFRGIDRLPPAHYLTVTETTVRLSRYWSPEHSPEVRLHSDAEYIEAFRERFDGAVKAQLRAVGGVASHLSAGLDSGSVTATAARLLGPTGGHLTAFTAIPRPGAAGAKPGRLGNEGLAAAEVAAMYANIEHVLLDSAGQSFLDTLDPFIAAADRPPSNPTNNIWITAIQREAAARGCSVILTGAYGNATISQTGLGLLSEWFRQGRWLQLARTVWKLRSPGSQSFAGLAAETVLPGLPRWVRRQVIGRRFSLSYSLVHPEISARLRLREQAWEALNPPIRDARGASRYLLNRSDSGPYHLAAQATHGVDVRDPTFDKRVVEFCFGIPAEQFIREGQSRSLIRRGMHGRLPDSTLTRRARGLQSADWHLGMAAIRAEMLAEVTLLEQSPIARRLLDLGRARDLLARWPERDYHTRAVKAPWHLALSRGLAVGRFIRRFDPHALQLQ